jgi:hypothetical protein
VVAAYLEELCARLQGALGDRLVGVYVLGGYALGAYVPGRSDLDVLAVVRRPLDDAAKRDVAVRCSHAALPCPARKLELVVSTGTPRWELNLNTGEGEPEHVGTDPDAEPRFWFVLDLALAHAHAAALLGPPAESVLAAPGRDEIEAAQAEAVAWYARHEPGADAFAAAARAWYWRETGGFAPKDAAVAWAAARWATAGGRGTAAGRSA